MKRNALLFFICILSASFLASCNSDDSESEPEPSIDRKIWDADNIAFENTEAEITSGDYYERISGTTGIIGEFEIKDPVYIGATMSTRTISYTFKDTGYYKYKEQGYTKDSNGKPIPYTNTDSGTYVISKNSDGRFYLVQTSDEYHGITRFYYLVNNEKISFDNK